MPHQCTNCGRTFDDGSKEMLSGCPDCDGTKFQFSPDGFDGDDPEPDAEPPDPPERPGDGVSRTVGSTAATVRDIVGGSAGPDATQASPPEPATADSSTVDATADSSTVDATADSPAADGTADSSDDDIIVADSTPVDGEDTAQANARSQLAGPDDLPDSADFQPTVADEAGEEETTESADDASVSDSTDVSVEADADPEDAPDVTDTPNSSAPDADRTVAETPDTEEADRPDLAELREELNDQFESIRIVDRGQYELNLMELYDRDAVVIALQEDGRYSIRMPEAIGEADV